MSGRNWGRWGPDDERGSLNLVTPQAVVRGTQAVKTGRVYSLALPMSRTRTPPVFGRPAPERFTRTGPDDVVAAGESRARTSGGAGGAVPVGANEDVVQFSSHAGTHMDALSHVFSGETFYNGHPTSSFSTRTGASRLAITSISTLATRGLLLDVLAARAADGEVAESTLPAGSLVTAADLVRCCELHELTVEPGDAVLIRTGWSEAFSADRSTPAYPQAGIGTGAATWLAERDVALVGADNSAVEVLPFESDQVLPVHVELIVSSGIPLLEHLYLADLAADGCHEFLLVVGALPISGATGSPVNPVAIG